MRRKTSEQPCILSSAKEQGIFHLQFMWGCLATGTWQLVGDHSVMGSKAGITEQVQKWSVLIAFCKGHTIPGARWSGRRNCYGDLGNKSLSLASASLVFPLFLFFSLFSFSHFPSLLIHPSIHLSCCPEKNPAMQIIMRIII